MASTRASVRMSALTLSVLTLFAPVLLMGSPAAAADEAPPARVIPQAVLPESAPLRLADILPVHGYRLTGRFGDVSGLWRTVHTGLDFAAGIGTPIRAIGSGVVVSTGYDGAYGNKTVLRLDDGTELWFCHQSRILVTTGEHVRAGRVIGEIGNTGNTTGPHLHLEVHPHGGEPIDPYPWLVARGLRP